MDVASELNKDVVTDFPIAEAVGKLRARRLSRHRAALDGAPNAPAPNGDDSDDTQLATQWMVDLRSRPHDASRATTAST